MPLESTTPASAREEALAYAEKHGLYVIVYAADGDQHEVAVCPPTIQTDMVPTFVKHGMRNVGIPAHLN